MGRSRSRTPRPAATAASKSGRRAWSAGRVWSTGSRESSSGRCRLGVRRSASSTSFCSSDTARFSSRPSALLGPGEQFVSTVSAAVAGSAAVPSGGTGGSAASTTRSLRHLHRPRSPSRRWTDAETSTDGTHLGDDGLVDVGANAREQVVHRGIGTVVIAAGSAGADASAIGSLDPRNLLASVAGRSHVEQVGEASVSAAGRRQARRDRSGSSDAEVVGGVPDRLDVAVGVFGLGAVDVGVVRMWRRRARRASSGRGAMACSDMSVASSSATTRSTSSTTPAAAAVRGSGHPRSLSARSPMIPSTASLVSRNVSRMLARPALAASIFWRDIFRFSARSRSIRSRTSRASPTMSRPTAFGPFDLRGPRPTRRRRRIGASDSSRPRGRARRRGLTDGRAARLGLRGPFVEHGRPRRRSTRRVDWSPRSAADRPRPGVLAAQAGRVGRRLASHRLGRRFGFGAGRHGLVDGLLSKQ